MSFSLEVKYLFRHDGTCQESGTAKLRLIDGFKTEINAMIICNSTYYTTKQVKR